VEETASFEDSRRLTGPNLFFARPGAVLEALGVDAVPKDVIEQWRINVRAMSAELGWADVELHVRAHAKRPFTGADGTRRSIVQRNRSQ
jgi:hypothetical protein